MATREANTLSTVASQRTQLEDITIYGFDVIAAAIGTIFYVFAASLYRKYRIKRRFQVRIRLK
jgi:hypothetical protein